MSDKETDLAQNNRILIVDDNPSIHEDFKKILPTGPHEKEAWGDLLQDFLGDEGGEANDRFNLYYELEHAYQGNDALKMVKEAEDSGNPYALIFVDVRMPPGWDGIETIRRIWDEYPNNEIVIVTAYSDYSWEDILDQLGTSDQLQFIRKPFNLVTLKQMTLAIVKKWNLAKKARHYVADLEQAVNARTKELQEKVAELEKAMEEIKELRGILPVCAWCHKIRGDDNYWMKVDDYLSSHTRADISHCICPACYDKMMDDIDGDENADNGGGNGQPAASTTPDEKKETE